MHQLEVWATGVVVIVVEESLEKGNGVWAFLDMRTRAIGSEFNGCSDPVLVVPGGAVYCCSSQRVWRCKGVGSDLGA